MTGPEIASGSISLFHQGRTDILFGQDTALPHGLKPGGLRRAQFCHLPSAMRCDRLQDITRVHCPLSAMTLRTLKLPSDLHAAVELTPLAFQYPESDAWSMRPDEVDSLVDMLSALTRLWPLAWLARFVFPALRDALCGHVWEEDRRLVGLAIFQRCGASDTWLISSVAVLPDYRRRGIGQKLVRATLDAICKRGGRVALLKVIAGNVPAYTLYERLGFEDFAGDVVLDYGRNELPPELPLPGGYTASLIDPLDWQADYRLARRVIPIHVQEHEPVEEARFRRALSMRLLMPLVWKAGGVRSGKIAIRTTPGGQVVALAEYMARVRLGGMNRISASVDPAHAELAPYLVRHLIRVVQRQSPGRRIEISVPEWQGSVIEAAHDAGFVKSLEHRRLGIILPG
jgi:GNAT superfamily N-acetyltransferase